MDSDNGIPLYQVKIENSKNNSVTFSNKLGEFEVPDAGVYQFSKSGYKVYFKELKSSDFIIIQLELHPSQLNEVVVNAHHIPQKLKKSSTTIDIISTKDIERGNSLNMAEALNRIPSVFMQSGALNTNKISIRGIGSRNLYGTSKIRAYFQDIPLTSGNGETSIEDFELGTISRIEIIKGAGSSIYGAGLGGTIHLIPQNSHLNQSSIQSDLSVGSFGLIKGVINVNHGTTKNSFRTIYSNTHSNGYRDNNKYNRQTFTLNSNHYINAKNHLTFLASYVDLKGYIPSSINETTFNNNPKAAAFTWAQTKGFEDSKHGIFGLSWNHKYSSNTKQLTSIFTSFKDSYEPRPFNILSELTAAVGVRSRIIGSFNKIEWTLGGELFKDTYKSKTYENLYQDYPSGTGSVKGEKLSDLKENRSYFNIFFETNYNPTDATTLSIGLNFNNTSYNLFDNYITNDAPDQSGSYNFKGMLSPKIGVSHVVTQHISIYSNISHGFSPPTTAETLLPEGLINTNIKPETGWNFEVGTRTSFYNNRLQLNLALYKLDIRNLLVARRTGDDQFIGVNAGKTQHHGLELVSKYEWLEKEAVSINQYATYTLNDFKFKEFTDDGNNYSGNKLTGVPSNVFNSGIDISTKTGLYTTLNYQYVGRIPMTDSNSLFTDSYMLTNIKLGYKRAFLKSLTLNACFGLDNIFNKHYASQILINATGFGGAAPRYYYPGNLLNYYSGLNINYIF
ncbi:TonB-dependent receptor family protein [Mariniflexile aquimaris]|uniref:TonB-dependent receptor family protein n=1 Tax=Mariniflexile aquimaris TaxID=881009 RepID=A0ABW3BQL2_9FLAO